ncbi:hypothetical protein B0H16DRAFT_1767195 [Mycena metata]|uniref:Uncharacterized protein n=1 Tax=Mycena metata TaxID=1033252 RepID=A0AAD7I413_9AGAR|nr:hypothetical protein B0H16DRAFT_1767195 [Mycena metata]
MILHPNDASLTRGLGRGNGGRRSAWRRMLRERECGHKSATEMNCAAIAPIWATSSTRTAPAGSEFPPTNLTAPPHGAPAPTSLLISTDNSVFLRYQRSAGAYDFAHQPSVFDLEHPKFPSIPSVISLSSINVRFLMKTLWDPTKYLTLQPVPARQSAVPLRDSAQEVHDANTSGSTPAWQKPPFTWLPRTPTIAARIFAFLDRGSPDVSRYVFGTAPVVPPSSTPAQAGGARRMGWRRRCWRWTGHAKKPSAALSANSGRGGGSGKCHRRRMIQGGEARRRIIRARRTRFRRRRYWTSLRVVADGFDDAWAELKLNLTVDESLHIVQTCTTSGNFDPYFLESSLAASRTTFYPFISLLRAAEYPEDPCKYSSFGAPPSSSKPTQALPRPLRFSSSSRSIPHGQVWHGTAQVQFTVLESRHAKNFKIKEVPNEQNTFFINGGGVTYPSSPEYPSLISFQFVDGYQWVVGGGQGGRTPRLTQTNERWARLKFRVGCIPAIRANHAAAAEWGKNKEMALQQ